jgi:polyphosphate kinase
VLQEAEDKSTPLFERLKFLGIFSSNLDEFFRVRVATTKRLMLLKKKDREQAKFFETKKVIEKIHETVVKLQNRFDLVYNQIKEELTEHNIFIINEDQLTEQQTTDTITYFKSEVLSRLVPILFEDSKTLPELKDHTLYLAIKMTNEEGKKNFALLEMPTNEISRFFVLPSTNEENYILLLEDVIRVSLPILFSNLEYTEFEAFTAKVTLDAEIDIDLNLLDISFLEKMKKSLKQRQKGKPVRFIYENNIPKDLLKVFIEGLELSKEDLISGQRYHNFKDFMSFPKLGFDTLNYKDQTPIPIPNLETSKSMLDAILKKDYILHHPYQSFDYVVRLLRESAIDPYVKTIRISLYRVAKNSNIVKALINARKNGKKVIVLMELQARFDEESNIYWSKKLQEAGAEVLFGIPNLKVHTKLCIIKRVIGNEVQHVAHIATGNYNGSTAKLYCDSGILTANPIILEEVLKVFNLIRNQDNYKTELEKYKFNNLMVSPINSKSEIIRRIEKEAKFAKDGAPSYLIFKMNSLTDIEVIEVLYKASGAGVRIALIVRGICCLIPGVKGLSENIRVISIVDRYLEHARIYLFGNGGKEKIFMGSADLMTRNLDNRIELCIPILDSDVKEEISKMLEIQLKDNVKARLIDKAESNNYIPTSIPKIRAQDEFYLYLKNKYKI